MAVFCTIPQTTPNSLRNCRLPRLHIYDANHYADDYAPEDDDPVITDIEEMAKFHEKVEA